MYRILNHIDSQYSTKNCSCVDNGLQRSALCDKITKRLSAEYEVITLFLVCNHKYGKHRLNLGPF